jgi:hypothetical protein
LILSIPEADKVEKELKRLAPERSLTATRLNAFTVAEVGIFLDHLRRQKSKSTVHDALRQFQNNSNFSSIVDEWAATSITLRSKGQTIKEFGKDFNESRRQYYPGEE